jgi:multiple sugar transport system substrate-binding protein
MVTTTRRDFLRLTGLVAGGVALGACGSGSNGTAAGKSLATSSGKASGSIKILDDNTNKVFSASAIRTFEQKTGVKVADYQQLNFNDLHDRMATMFSAQDTSFDVVMTWAGFSAEFGQAGWLQELDRSTLPSDVIQPALDAVSWNGKVYGLPKFSSVQTMFWNKKLFTKAGLDPDKGPQDFDEFVKAAKAMTGGNNYGFCCDMGNPAGAYQNFLRALLMNGGQMYDANYNPTFASEQGVEALTKWVALLRSDKVMNPASLQITNASDLADLFAKGTTGIVFNWPFQYAVATASSSALDKSTLGNDLIPGMSVRSGSIDGSEGFAINAYSKNKAGALEWLKFAASPEIQRQIVTTEGWFPVSRSVLNDPAMTQALPVLKTYAASTKYVTKRYGTPWSNEFDQLLSVQLNSAMLGKTTPKAALTTAQAGCEALVKKYLKK